MTEKARAELRALAYQLRRLVLSTARAARDGVLSLDELVAIGAGDLPGLIAAIVALATPNEGEGRARVLRDVRVTRARVVVRQGRALVARKRRADRLRRQRETRHVLAPSTLPE